MKADDVIELLKKAKVEEAIKAAGEVEDKKEMASKLTEFAAALNYLKGLPILSEALLKESLLFDFSNPNTHYNLGVLYSSLNAPDKDGKNVELAEKAYKTALRFKDDFHEARYNLALLYYFTGRLDEARKEYAKITEALGDDVHYRDLGVMLLEVERLEAG
jgi:tetratricopeptide (TPR) repeat protein